MQPDIYKARLKVDQNRTGTDPQANLKQALVDDPVALVDDPSAGVGAPTTINPIIPLR